jgi:hypothetical protein
MTDASNEVALEKIASEINAAHSVKGLPKAAKNDMQTAEAEVIALEKADKPVVAPTAPAPATGARVPLVAAYADWVQVRDDDFQAMGKANPSTGQVPAGYALVAASQIMGSPGTVSADLISMDANGLHLQVGSQTEGTGIQGTGAGIKGPYYRETDMTLNPNANHPSSWTLTTRTGDDASIDGEVDETEGGWGEDTGTVHNGPESALYAYGPANLPGTSGGVVSTYNDDEQVTWYVNGVLDSDLGGGRANPAKFPETIPADTLWYPLHVIVPGSGLFGATSPTVTGAAGEYVVRRDTWWVPPAA